MRFGGKKERGVANAPYLSTVASKMFQRTVGCLHKGFAPAALEPRGEGLGFFQCLKGLQEEWRGAFHKGG